jgi:hypothetical protein
MNTSVITYDKPNESMNISDVGYVHPLFTNKQQGYK